jgi:hypothetical protein
MAVYRRHKCLLHPVSDTATTDGKISYARVDADWWKRPEPGEILKALPRTARVGRTQRLETFADLKQSLPPALELLSRLRALVVFRFFSLQLYLA